MPPHRSPRYAVARERDNAIVIGPSNTIWLIACDWKDPVHGHASEAGMWWRFANISDPAADGRIFRMNAQPTQTITDAANEPDAFVSTLADAIRATNGIDSEDICLFWHGVHINSRHENTPHRLRNADEEYYGQVHRRSAVRLPRHPTAADREAAAAERRRRLAPSRGMVHAEYVESEHSEVARTDYDDTRINAHNRRYNEENERYVRTVDEEREVRRTWDEMFMFNWPDRESHRAQTPPPRYDRHGQLLRPEVRPDDLDHARNQDWPTRYENPNYVRVVQAFNQHPHARRIHLYGCDLADPEYLKPILDLTRDIAAGGQGEPTVQNKEIWVYSDFTETDWYGERMFISHTRGNPTPEKGVTQRGDGYEVVRLHTEHGPLPGWQVRGRMVGGRPIVEKVVVERGGTRRHPTTTVKVEKIDASGISSPRTETHGRRTVTVSHYTPFETVIATDPTAPPPASH